MTVVPRHLPLVDVEAELGAGRDLIADRLERLTDDILTSAGVDVGQFRSTLKTLITAMDPAGLRASGFRPQPTEPAT